MNWLQLMLAPVGIPVALAGWWMVRNAGKAADATIRFERSSPLAKWSRPPGALSRAIEKPATESWAASYFSSGAPS